MPETISIKRWYDKQPEVKTSVTMLGRFPQTFQVTLADGLSSLAERRYHAHQLIRNTRTMGKDKVLSLYKSKNKLRKTDENPFFYTLGNYLLVLPAKECYEMSDDMLHLMHGVLRYFKTCRDALAEPRNAIVSEITDTYVMRGRLFAERLIHELEAETIQTIELSSEVMPKAEDSGRIPQDLGLRMHATTKGGEFGKKN